MLLLPLCCRAAQVGEDAEDRKMAGGRVSVDGRVSKCGGERWKAVLKEGGREMGGRRQEWGGKKQV